MRTVLAVLLLDVNRVVSADTLAERIWGEELPRRPKDAMYSYLSRLRAALAGAENARIARRSGGYVLEADQDSVDLHRFRDLVARSTTLTDDNKRGEVLGEALGLWTNDALVGVESPWVDEVRETLTDERLAARLDEHDVRFRLDRHAELVVPLTVLAAERPFDERVAHQLIDALARSGQQAQALTRYETVRRHLADELGIDPSSQLRKLHQRLLSPGELPTRAVPRQLPLAPRHFVGRARELDALTDAGEHTVLISAIRGAGGIGKTWLALHWAHRHAESYPDGQLYVNLRGFDPTTEPVDPAMVLRRFLTSLGMPPDSLPGDVDALAGLYRTAVAGRKMLVVLDNAANTEQVVPLVPGAETCRTLITSRHPLTGLIAAHSAVSMPLDVLPDDEARDLLTARLGAHEPESITDIVRHCGGLPLALGIVAARAAVRTNLSLASIATELRETRLDALDAGDLSLRTTLSWSYRALSGPAATLFGLLGTAPSMDLGVAAIDALLAEKAALALAELEAAHLVTRTGPDRYRMHDLVHLYASEQPMPGRDAALQRLINFYLHSAIAADRWLYPHRSPLATGPAPAGCASHDGITAAMSWYEDEYACLLAIQRLPGPSSWQLARLLSVYQWRTGKHHDTVDVWRVALAEIHSLDDDTAKVLAHRSFGDACASVTDLVTAAEHLEQAVELAAWQGDLTEEAHAHNSLAWLQDRHGHHEQALLHATCALAHYRRLDKPEWEADMLNCIGWTHAHLGNHELAQAHCEAALELCRRHDHLDGALHTLKSLGFLAHHTGAYADAVRYCKEALALCRRLSHNYIEASVLTQLGESERARGRVREAEQAWLRAVDLYRTQRRTTAVRKVENLLAAASTEISRVSLA
ncbi:BTAD domain-containing putative transcriptional regulator [Lentzea chajnantorensis]